jgi:2-polyprenyl-3-methyl-5-hydroxy-6-metoxy-1,4-benzoquinol methylase
MKSRIHHGFHMPESERISSDYRAQLEVMHKSHKRWGDSAPRWALRVLDVIHEYKPLSVLDYGAGKGALKVAMINYGVTEHIDWREYDPAIPSMAAEPERADVVVCLDVLEHVEFTKIAAVLRHLCSLTAKACFIVVNTRASRAVLPDGRNAHISVRDAVWWRAQLKAAGLHEVRSHTTHKELVYLGIP